jgi:arabinose-5-phosphate isomerase
VSRTTPATPAAPGLERARALLREEAQALADVAARLDDGFARALALLAARRGKVVVSGIGKSGLVARKIAATFTSTGTPAFFLHPVEALHGDAGLVEQGDVALVLSKSGAGDELDGVLPLFARLGVPVVALTEHADSPLGRAAQAVVAFGPLEEAGGVGGAPTTSALVAMALGDAFAVALAHERGFRADDFHFLHPGGVLGRRALLRASDVMHKAPGLPIVAAGETVHAALLAIMSGRLGLTCVVDATGALSGVLTDGDLKRILLARGTEDLFTTPVEAVMNRAPRTIEGTALVAAAVRAMEENEPGPITALIVVDAAGRPEGVLHLHDCIRLGVR